MELKDEIKYRAKLFYYVDDCTINTTNDILNVIKNKTFCHLFQNKAIVDRAIAMAFASCKNVPIPLQNNRAFVLETVKIHEEYLKIADETLKKDKLFAIELVTVNPWSLKFIDISIKNDKEIILCALKNIIYYQFYIQKHVENPLKNILLQAKNKEEIIKYLDVFINKPYNYKDASIDCDVNFMLIL